MKPLRRALTAVLLVASVARAIGLESDDPPTARERSPEELVTSVDIKSTHVAAVAAERQRAWLERVGGEPFRIRAKGQPWEKEAVAFLADGLAAWDPRSIYELDEELAARGRQLHEGGCDDPLVLGRAARFHYRGTYDHFFHCHGIADSSGELSADVFSDHRQRGDARRTREARRAAQFSPVGRGGDSGALRRV